MYLARTEPRRPVSVHRALEAKTDSRCEAKFLGPCLIAATV